MVNFSYAVRVFKAELQSFLDLRIPIVKSVNSLEAEISPVIKNVRRFPATRNGGHIMLPHWKHLFLGQRKSIANMFAQGWSRRQDLSEDRHWHIRHQVRESGSRLRWQALSRGVSREKESGAEAEESR